MGFDLASVPRHSIASLPTPLQHLRKTSEHLGVEFWIKRDDLTEFAMSGNKIRKLEYLLSDAQEHGADGVITCGGKQSNHCRATAIAAAKLGLGCTLFLRTDDPENPPTPQGNILLDVIAGANIKWVTPEQYKNRAALFEQEVKAAQREGKTLYPIVEGGSNGIGALGYVRAMQELLDQMPDLNETPTTIVHACGSGGTTTGLALGCKHLGLDKVTATAINVCDDADYFHKELARIGEDFAQKWPLHLERQDYRIIDGHVGLGYSLATDDELKEQLAFAKREGILLDPCYSGKAYVGLQRELHKDSASLGKRIVFIHTGGAFALFDFAQRIAALQ